MTIDDYFKNERLYKSLADEVNANKGLHNAFSSALEQISSVPDYRRLLETTAFKMSTNASYQRMQDLIFPWQTATIGAALSDGFAFSGAGNKLRTVFEPFWEQQRQLNEAQSVVQSLVEKSGSFADNLKTSVYINHGLNYTSVGLKAFQNSTTWLKEESPWRMAVERITEIGTTRALADLDSTPFTRLLEAENRTAQLLSKANTGYGLTSAATQMASMLQAFSEDNLRGFDGFSSLIKGYGDFAFSQHKGIQKAIEAGHDQDAQWRIGLLDVTSKFVDRQVTRGSSIESVIEEIAIVDDNDSVDSRELIDKDHDESGTIEREELIDETSFFKAIPQQIGYTNREYNTITQEEALEKSTLVEITELGFGIVDRILEVNRLQDILNADNVFRSTSKNMRTMGKLGQFICDDQVKFEKMIKGIYFLIYENQNGIKKMLGNGDADIGKELIKGKDYECMFRIKNIRTDLEHDIEHGKEKEQKKKHKEINEAYEYYLKKKPSTAKEYKKFQICFYKDIIDLIDKFIFIISNRVKEAEQAIEGGES